MSDIFSGTSTTNTESSTALTYGVMLDAIKKIKDLYSCPMYTHVVGHSETLSRLETGGLGVVRNDLLTRHIQTRFPRCNKKKRRITKKFKKKYFKEFPEDNVYLINTGAFNNFHWSIKF